MNLLVNASQYLAIIRKKSYDHKINHKSYSEGDKVWYYSPQCKPGMCAKLSRPWKGPYTIKNKINDVIYRIQSNPKTKPKVVHHDRLKPYK